MRRRLRVTQRNLLEAIDRAYGAVDDPSGWPAFLETVADCVGGRATALMSHDMTHAGAVAINVRSDPEATRAYNEHWHGADPRALSPRARTLIRPGRAVPDQMLVRYADVERTAYHRGFSRKFGIARTVSLSLAADPGAFRGLSITRSHEDPPFEGDEIRFLEALAPHAQRALRLRDVLTRLQSELGAVRDGLDALDVVMLFVDARGHVRHANRAARRLLDAHDGLSLRRGSLAGANARATEALRALCRSCHGVMATPDGGGGPLSLPRPSGRANLHALVLPTRRSAAFDSGLNSVVALVLVSEPDAPAPPVHDLLRAFHGLTPAESKVAEQLVLGHSIEQIADTLGYTRQTVGWYCKQLLAKTGSGTRAALVRQLTRTLASLTRV